MKKLRRFVLTIAHPLAHAIRWNLKYKVSSRDAQGAMWTGYQCLGCDKITSLHAIKYPKEKTFPIATIPSSRHVRLITIFEGSLTILAGVFKDGWVTTDFGGQYPIEAFHEWAPLGRHQRNYSMRIQASS